MSGLLWPLFPVVVGRNYSCPSAQARSSNFQETCSVSDIATLYKRHMFAVHCPTSISIYLYLTWCSYFPTKKAIRIFCRHLVHLTPISETMSIPLNRSCSLPVAHATSILLVSGRIPALFDKKPCREPLRMEDKHHHILYFLGFTPLLVIKQNFG